VDGLTLLRDARTAGLAVTTDGDRLIIRGPRALESLARSVLAAKPAVLAALATETDEVAWRIAAMRPQVPASGPVPLLLARSGIHFPLVSCCSCGDPLPAPHRYRCDPCTAAVIAVLEAAR
jgi:hypothetical protein